jgi:hypothetical protein
MLSTVRAESVPPFLGSLRPGTTSTRRFTANRPRDGPARREDTRETRVEALHLEHRLHTLARSTCCKYLGSTSCCAGDTSVSMARIVCRSFWLLKHFTLHLSCLCPTLFLQYAVHVLYHVMLWSHAGKTIRELTDHRGDWGYKFRLSELPSMHYTCPTH